MTGFGTYRAAGCPPDTLCESDDTGGLAARVIEEMGQSLAGRGWAYIGSVALTDDRLGQGGLMRRRPARVPAPRSSFAGFRFPPDVITVAVRWYLRYGLSYRDVEELLAERGIAVITSPSIGGCSGSPRC